MTGVLTENPNSQQNPNLQRSELYVVWIWHAFWVKVSVLGNTEVAFIILLYIFGTQLETNSNFYFHVYFFPSSFISLNYGVFRVKEQFLVWSIHKTDAHQNSILQFLCNRYLKRPSIDTLIKLSLIGKHDLRPNITLKSN